MITAPLAVGALSSLLGPTSPKSVSGAGPSALASGDSFSSLLSSFSSDTIQKMKTAEASSISGIQGKATTQSVVEAVMAAQEQLQTALAVRDKAVTAFQDITRMPI